MKYAFLKISQNSQENTCARVSFFNKVQTAAYISTTASGNISCDIIQKLSKNNYFQEYA